MRALQLRPRPGCLAVAGLTGNFGRADQSGLVCQWEGWSSVGFLLCSESAGLRCGPVSDAESLRASWFVEALSSSAPSRVGKTAT